MHTHCIKYLAHESEEAANTLYADMVGLVWSGLAWPGLAWPGLAWSGLV